MPKKKPTFCLSKARKTNLFNATVKEAKVKDFAIFYFLRYHGFIKVMIKKMVF